MKLFAAFEIYVANNIMLFRGAYQTAWCHKREDRNMKVYRLF